eukprot:3558914-Karenia_brevis.AAC.1
MVHAIQNRPWHATDVARFAAPIQETLEMITRSQQLSNNFHFPDVAKWKKIEKRYKDGALHCAVP